MVPVVSAPYWLISSSTFRRSPASKFPAQALTRFLIQTYSSSSKPGPPYLSDFIYDLTFFNRPSGVPPISIFDASLRITLSRSRVSPMVSWSSSSLMLWTIESSICPQICPPEGIQAVRFLKTASFLPGIADWIKRNQQTFSIVLKLVELVFSVGFFIEDTR